MKSMLITGGMIKSENGSGYSLRNAFPKRKFHNSTVYLAHYSGADIDCSTVTRIKRARSGWATKTKD